MHHGARVEATGRGRLAPRRTKTPLAAVVSIFVRLLASLSRGENRHKQFVIDGEAVILGVDGISDFNALHSCQHDEDVQLYRRN